MAWLNEWLEAGEDDERAEEVAQDLGLKIHQWERFTDSYKVARGSSGVQEGSAEAAG